MNEKENTLPLVSKIEEIIKNVETLDRYLNSLNSQECEYAKGLIKRGRNFVVAVSDNNYRFYPSRFMGYVGNTMLKHEKMGEMKRKTGSITRDGRKTTNAINKILHDFIIDDDNRWNRLEAEFNKFCTKLKISPNNNLRKYWKPINC